MLHPQCLAPAFELVSSSPALLHAGKPWAGRSWPFSRGEIPAKAAVSSQERSGPQICPLASRSCPLLPSVPPCPAGPQALGGALRWKSCPQGWWSCSLDNPDKKLTPDNPLLQKIPRRLFSSPGRRWGVVTTLPFPEEIPWWRHLVLWPGSGALSFSDPCCRAPKIRRIFLKCCWSMQAAAVDGEPASLLVTKCVLGWVLQNLAVISIDVPKTWVSLGVDVLQSKVLWGCFPTEDKRAAGCMDLKAF